MLLHRAVATLMAGRTFTCRGHWGDYSIEAEDGLPVPTDSEVEAAIAIVTADAEANKYKTDRKNAYPTVEDVIEAMIEKYEEGKPEKMDAILLDRQSVKDEFPEPVK